MQKRTILWDITSKCNLRCRHCYNADKYFSDREYSVLNTSQISAILKRISHFGYKHIHLLGGEPLVRQDIWEIIREAGRCSIEVTLNTNGTFLTTTNISKMLSALNLSQIVISIDGPTVETNDNIRGKGVFKNVTSNVRKLVAEIKKRRSKVITAISSIISEDNAAQLYKFGALLEYMGVNYLFLLNMYDCGNARAERLKSRNYFRKVIPHLVKAVKTFDMYPDLHVQFDAKPKLATYLNRICGKKIVAVEPSVCHAGNNMLAIDPDGTLYPCGAFSQPQHQKDLAINIPKVDISNLKQLSDFLSMESFKKFLILKESAHTTYCKSCEFSAVCHGICPLYVGHDDVPLECKAADYFQERLFMDMLPVSYTLVRTDYKGSGDVAMIVLDLIKQGHTFRSIIHQLSKKFRVSLPLLRRDIGGYLSDLIVEGIIKPVKLGGE